MPEDRLLDASEDSQLVRGMGSNLALGLVLSKVEAGI